MRPVSVKPRMIPRGTDRTPLTSKTANEDLSQSLSDFFLRPRSNIFSVTKVRAKSMVVSKESFTEKRFRRPSVLRHKLPPGVLRNPPNPSQDFDCSSRAAFD